MIAAVLTSIGEIEVRDVPDPLCGPKDVVVRVEVCTICGTDLKIFNYGHSRLALPHVLGHEVSGIVTEIGADVDGFALGDVVVVAPAGVGCTSCHYCLTGLENRCKSRRAMGYEWQGGFAEYVRVPGEMLAGGCLRHVPVGLDMAEAALTEPLACVLNGQGQLALVPGESVVIIGAGPIGIMHAIASKAAGAEHIFIIDISDERLRQVPPNLGAVTIDGRGGTGPARVTEATDGLGANAVIVTAPAPVAQQQALDYVRKGGRVSLFAGLPSGTKEILFNTNKVHYDEISLFGTSGARVSHAAAALRLLADPAAPGRALISDHFSLQNIGEALQHATSLSGLKVAIHPHAP